MAADPNAQLVVGVTARLDQFEKQLAKAGLIADKGVKDIEKKFANLNPSISSSFGSGFLTGFFSTGAIEKLIRALAEANHNIAELGETARRAGVDVKRLQEFQFAGTRFGVPQESVDKGVEAIASQLNQARKAEKANETELGRLFEDNNIKLRDRNGIMISTAEALLRLADLFRGLREEQDKIDLAKKLGLPPDLIPLLTQGADAIKRVSDEATKAGTLIDANIIAKAKQFDLAWGEAVTNFGRRIKATIIDLGTGFNKILHELDDAIEAGEKTIASGGSVLGRARSTPSSSGTRTTPSGGGSSTADRPFGAGLADRVSASALAGRVPEVVGGLAADAAKVAVERSLEKYGERLNVDAENARKIAEEALRNGLKARAGQIAAGTADAADGEINVTAKKPLAPLPSKDVTTLPARPVPDRQETRIRSDQEIAAQERLEKYIDTLVRQQDVEKVIQETIGKSNAVREAAIAVARAQVDLDKVSESAKAGLIARIEEEAAKLELLKQKNEELRRAQVGVNDASRFFGEATLDVLDRVIAGGEKFSDVLKDVVRNLAKAVLQATLLGTGPFANLFGTSPTAAGGAGGGIFGLIASFFGGFKAGGGAVMPGKGYIVGENGPEWFQPNVSGRIIPGAQSGGGSQFTDARMYNIDARGAEAGVEQKIIGALREYDRGLLSRIAEKQART